jgi:competence ComEA-like helix-hairpin-helix protein
MVPLTQEEKKVVVFFLGLLLFGMGLDFARKKTGPFHLIEEEAIKKEVFRKVDINKASLHQLRSVPGVGPKLALAIFDDRKAQGDFKQLEEIKRVKGIKDKKFKEIEPYICIEDTR